MSNLLQCVNDAIKIKLSPTSNGLHSTLTSLRQYASYGGDAFLIEMLSSTIGGAFKPGAVMQNESNIVEAASSSDKKAAFDILATHLWKMRDEHTEQEATSLLISELQARGLTA